MFGEDGGGGRGMGDAPPVAGHQAVLAIAGQLVSHQLTGSGLAPARMSVMSWWVR